MEHSQFAPNDWFLTKGSLICMMRDGPTANARLIAAAPTMLATLQTVLESMGDYYDAIDAAGEEGGSLHDLVESTIHQATNQDE